MTYLLKKCGTVEKIIHCLLEALRLSTIYISVLIDLASLTPLSLFALMYKK